MRRIRIRRLRGRLFRGMLLPQFFLGQISILEGGIALILISTRNRQRKVINVQLLSDLCDLTVPSTAIGWASFDDGIVGLAGTVSSLLGVYGVWQKTA